MSNNDERRQLIAAARRYLAARDAATTDNDRPLLPQVQHVVDRVARIRATAAGKRAQNGSGNGG